MNLIRPRTRRVERAMAKAKEGDTTGATTLMMGQLVKDRKWHGDNSEEVAFDLYFLGKLHDNSRDLSAALTYYKQAVDASYVAHGEESWNHVASLEKAAVVACRLGSHSEAARFAWEAAAILKRGVIETNEDVAELLMNLAKVLQKANRKEECLHILPRTQSAFRDVFGELGLGYFNSLTHITVLYNRLGEFESALETGFMAESVLNNIPSSGFTEWYLCITNLVIILTDSERYEEALGYAQKLLQLLKEEHGDGSGETMPGRMNVQNLLNKVQRYSEAQVMARETLEIIGTIKGSDLDAAQCHYHIGDSQLGRNDLKLAEASYLESLRIVGATDEIDSRTVTFLWTAGAYRGLARIYEDRDDLDGAERMMKRVLRRYSIFYPSNHELVKRVGAELNDLAIRKTGRKMTRKAEALENQYGVGSMEAREAWYDLSDFYEGKSKYQDALDVLSIIHERDLTTRPEDITALIQDIDAIGSIHTKRSDYKQALSIYREGVERVTSVLGRESDEVVHLLSKIESVQKEQHDWISRQETLNVLVEIMIAMYDDQDPSLLKLLSDRYMNYLRLPVHFHDPDVMDVLREEARRYSLTLKAEWVILDRRDIDEVVAMRSGLDKALGFLIDGRKLNYWGQLDPWKLRELRDLGAFYHEVFGTDVEFTYFSETLIRRALEDYRMVYDEDSLNYALCLTYLARIIHKRGQTKEAWGLFQRAMAILEDEDVIFRPDFVWVLLIACQSKIDDGDRDEAFSLLDEVDDVSDSLESTDRHLVAKGKIIRANLLEEEGNFNDALDYLRGALAIDLEVFPETHPFIKRDQDLIESMERTVHDDTTKITG